MIVNAPHTFTEEEHIIYRRIVDNALDIARGSTTKIYGESYITIANEKLSEYWIELTATERVDKNTLEFISERERQIVALRKKIELGGEIK